MKNRIIKGGSHRAPLFIWMFLVSFGVQERDPFYAGALAPRAQGNLANARDQVFVIDEGTLDLASVIQETDSLEAFCQAMEGVPRALGQETKILLRLRLRLGLTGKESDETVLCDLLGLLPREEQERWIRTFRDQAAAQISLERIADLEISPKGQKIILTFQPR